MIYIYIDWAENSVVSVRGRGKRSNWPKGGDVQSSGLTGHRLQHQLWRLVLRNVAVGADLITCVGTLAVLSLPPYLSARLAGFPGPVSVSFWPPHVARLRQYVC